MRQITIIVFAFLYFTCTTEYKTKNIDHKKTLAKTNPYDSGSTIRFSHKELSKQFNIDVTFKRYKNITNDNDSCIVKILVKEKSDPLILDSLKIMSHFYFDEIFKEAKNVRSLSAKVNMDREIVDNYFGDIIVADFNFDNRDDIAVINDCGGNGGAFYNYYLQDKNKKFILDRYLTDSMTYFPQRIDKQKRTLTTYVHAGVCCFGEHVYYLNNANNTWIQRSHKIRRIIKQLNTSIYNKLKIKSVMNTQSDLLEFIKTNEHDKLEHALKENPLLANSKTEQGISLLQFAIYSRNKMAVDLLKQHKQQLDVFESASIGDLECVKKQLRDNPHLLNAFATDGFTPLGLACFFGHHDIVKYLIERGADVNIAANNSFRVAPIHSASAISNYDIVELLIKHGADVNAKQMHGFAPLHSAAHNGQTKLAQLLIYNGTAINAKTNDGKTPLIIAIEKNFTETADLIKRNGGQ